MQHTSTQEVDGPLVHLIHVDASGDAVTRTVLGLTTRDDLEFAFDEDDEDVDLTTEYVARRYRVTGSADLEVSSLIAVDLEALELIGLVKDDGELTVSDEHREVNAADGEYIEIAFVDEANTALSDAQLINRFGDLELANPELDMSEVPPVQSWTWHVEGEMRLGAAVGDLETNDLLISGSETHTISAGTTETYDSWQTEPSGELTLEDEAGLALTENEA